MVNSESSLAQVRVWQQRGWIEAQTLAFARWGQAEVFTCKHATKRDCIYLSPEAAAICTAVSVWDQFAEHSTVLADLSITAMGSAVRKWPLPAAIPWDDVDINAWHGCEPVLGCQTPDPTNWMHHFAREYESSLAGFVVGRPGAQLPSNCRGRSRRCEPTEEVVQVAMVKASRQGEEVLCHDYVSQEVNRWFAQLRRLQSLLHATAAGKSTPEAQLYRASLWHAI